MGVRIEGIDGVKRYIRQEGQKRINDVIKILKRVGKQTVSAIKDSKISNWEDHSHNLRASIGYIVLHDGIVVDRFFELHDSKGDEGMKAGESFADELATQYPSGFVLIIVAGMEYAAYVEAIESKSVLAGGRPYAKKMIAELEAKYNAKYGK